jgi:acetyltransferase-like isoleucine patch superfamily enzyme
VRVGDDCHLAAGTTIVDTDGHAQQQHERAAGARDESLAVILGNGVWAGLRALVLKGVTIGDGTIVGAGSVVTRSLPAHTLCAGDPARVIRSA